MTFRVEYSQLDSADRQSISAEVFETTLEFVVPRVNEHVYVAETRLYARVRGVNYTRNSGTRGSTLIEIILDSH